MKPKISVIGDGNVGSALKNGLDRENYDARSVGKDPDQIIRLAEEGDIIILAVPYPALDEVVKIIGDKVSGKTVLDVTNVLTSDYELAIGFTTSGAEELQNKMPSAKVVKAFNTVFAQHMSKGKTKDTQLTIFAAGDDKDAKDKILTLARDIGFDAIDAGPLKNARWLETLGYLNIQLGYTIGMGSEIGFKLVH